MIGWDIRELSGFPIGLFGKGVELAWGGSLTIKATCSAIVYITEHFIMQNSVYFQYISVL